MHPRRGSTTGTTGTTGQTASTTGSSTTGTASTSNNHRPTRLQTELERYRNGTYELMPQRGQRGKSPFGEYPQDHDSFLPCHGCGQQVQITRWLRHNVNVLSDGTAAAPAWTRIAYYCAKCYPEIEKVVKRNKEKMNKK